MKILLSLTCLWALTLFTGVAAETKIGEISHAELKEALETKKAVIIDVNGTDSYKAGHIPTAIDFEKSKATLAKLLPADKSALIVAYCYGETCPAYRHAALAAIELGYTNVKHYKPGITGWKAKNEKVETAS